MAASAVDGSKANHFLFSPCSRTAIRPVIDAQVRAPALLSHNAFLFADFEVSIYLLFDLWSVLCRCVSPPTGVFLVFQSSMYLFSLLCNIWCVSRLHSWASTCASFVFESSMYGVLSGVWSFASFTYLALHSVFQFVCVSCCGVCDGWVAMVVNVYVYLRVFRLRPVFLP